MKIILVYFAYKYQGNWNQIYHALSTKEYVSFDEITKLEQIIKHKKWKILTILDKDYPHQLKLSYKPPFVLWYRGNKKVLNNKFVCVTGNYDNDIIHQRIKQFLLEIKAIYVLISLRHFAFDQIIWNYVAPKVHLIILASGLNNNISFSNENSFILSEYPPYVKENKDHLIACNRIIAAFSSSLIITSFIENNESQLLIDLIDNFFNLGKEVVYFSNNAIANHVNNALVKQTIKLITSIKDLPE